MMNESVVELNIACRVRKIRNRYILIGAKKCFEINEIGKIIWDTIDGKKTVKQIIASLEKDYVVEHITIENDVINFLEILLSAEAICVVNK